MFTVQVKNFQSLEDVDLEVSGLTVVTGTNNSGKSSLARSIQGVFANPRGFAYVRDGTSHCSVSVGFPDGSSVLWEKGEKVNSYTINGKTLNRVGQTVPKEVLSLGVQPVELTGRDPVWPQFAPQFTGQIFLLDQSGSSLAEAISDVERVRTLNEALRSAQSDQRSKVAERKVRESDITRLEGLEKLYIGLDAVGDSVTDLEKMFQEIAKLEGRLVYLRSLASRIQEVEKTIAYFLPVRDVCVPEGLDKILKIDQALQWMSTMRDRVSSATQSLAERKAQVDSLKGVKIPQIPDFGSLLPTLENLYVLRDNLMSATSNFAKIRTAHELALRELEQAEKDLTSVRESIKECPVCGSLTMGDSHTET